MVLLDFAKAFDKVPHDELLFKIEKYGFDGKLLAWIKDFLKGRKQRVILGSAHSDWLEVESGVPQGSPLSPLLFIIFINDMPDCLHHFCKLYADDSKLLAIIKNSLDAKLLQDDIDKVTDWASTWRMCFNIDKCKYMHFGEKKNTPVRKLLMSNNSSRLEISKTTAEKDLGVILTSNLKWDSQIKSCTNKANSMLGILKNTFKCWSTKAFKILFQTYVRPHLEYAGVVWNSNTKKHTKELEKIQRRATKLVPELTGLRYEERLLNLGLTSLENRRNRGDLIQQFKISQGLNTINWFHPTLRSARTSELRDRQLKLTKQIANCKARENFFTNRVVDSWNNLNFETISSSSINEFKNKFDASFVR